MMPITVIIFTILIWFRDINRESIIYGSHTMQVELGFQIGIILFIFSEIILFFRFFWTFFHRRISPTSEIGIRWPPYEIIGVRPYEIPLLNTIILLRRGIRVTWAHFNISQRKSSENIMIITLVLGVYFTYLQVIEYSTSSFTIRDRVFGNIFFISTGFHGAHVIIGRLILIYSLFRINSLHFSGVNPIGIEVSIWYWHFVDVVWLFLFSMVYWWGF